MFSLPYFVSSFFLLVQNRKTCILAPVKMLENCLSLNFETFCVIAKQSFVNNENMWYPSCKIKYTLDRDRYDDKFGNVTNHVSCHD